MTTDEPLESIIKTEPEEFQNIINEIAQTKTKQCRKTKHQCKIDPSQKIFVIKKVRSLCPLLERKKQTKRLSEVKLKQVQQLPLLEHPKEIKPIPDLVLKPVKQLPFILEPREPNDEILRASFNM